MAADVLMGNDQDASRWIRAYRVAPAEGEQGRRSNRRRTAGRRPSPARSADDAGPMTRVARERRRADPLVIFTPSGRRGQFRTGHHRARRGARTRRRHRLGLRDARDLRPLPGGPERRRVRQARDRLRPDHLSSFGAEEAAYRERRGIGGGRRLCCTAEVLGDVVIDVPAESQVHRQVVRKSLDLRRFRVDPVVQLHYVEVAEPDLASPTGDLARLLEALEREWGLIGLSVDLDVVRALQPALARGGWAVTVAVHDGRDVIAVWPGFHDRALGVAIDVGSTTIAGHLADLATARCWPRPG